MCLDDGQYEVAGHLRFLWTSQVKHIEQMLLPGRGLKRELKE